MRRAPHPCAAKLREGPAEPFTKHSLRHGHQGGHGSDAVPKVGEAEVLVGGVLVVVEVGDRDGDGAGIGGALHGFEGDGAAHGGEEDDGSAGALDGVDDLGGDGEVHGGADGGLGKVGDDAGYFGVLDEFVTGRLSCGNEEALGADVVGDALLLGAAVDADDEAHVEISRGGGRDGISGVRAGLTGGDAVDVQRRLVEEFEQMAARAVGCAEGEGVAEHGVVDGRVGEGFAFERAEGRDAVVEVRDEDFAVGILHPGEELDEEHGGVGCPVAVVSAVEGAVGAVEGDLEVGVAARAEDDGLAARLVDGTIADKPEVAGDQVAVGVEDLREMGRAGLLFSLPDEAKIDLWGEVRGLKSREGGELGENGGLVVARAASVDAGLAVDLLEERLEGLARLPFGGGDGLAVVVGIEDDGSGRAGRLEFAPDDRGRGGGGIGRGEELCGDSALLELSQKELGVAAEAGRVGGYVGEAKELHEGGGEFFVAWRDEGLGGGGSGLGDDLGGGDTRGGRRDR